MALYFQIRWHAVLSSPLMDQFVANSAGLCAHHPSYLLCFSVEESCTARVSPIVRKAKFGVVDGLNRAQDFRINSQRHCLSVTCSHS